MEQPNINNQSVEELKSKLEELDSLIEECPERFGASLKMVKLMRSSLQALLDRAEN